MFNFQQTVQDARELSELEQTATQETQSNVLSRWERKSLKATAQGTADRFIPSRSINRDVQLCNLQNDATENNSATSATDMPSAQTIKDALFDGNGDAKILAFKDKPAPAAAGHLNHMRVLYSQNKGTSAQPKKNFRHINTSSDRILDAPDLSDDFYLNLLDWSSQNTLAVALGQAVYLWNAESGDIDMLTELEGADNMVTSLAWSSDGNYLSIGANNSNVHLWQVEAKKQLRTMRGHSARVGAMAWNNHVLSTGSRDSMIFNHDVRIAQHKIASLKGHSLEICGLKWSDDGTTLASGGNDNVCNIWDVNTGVDLAPRFSFTQHTAAVKALAWCPWQRHVLATGAGTADRHIRLFNTQTSALLSAVDTESQVCSLQWGRHDKELVSAHGFSQNQLTVWRASGVTSAAATGAAPVLQKMADLTGHTARILHTAQSPDGTTVVSAGADETLRFWKVWDAPVKKGSSGAAGVPTGVVGTAQVAAVGGRAGSGGRMAAINIR